MGTMGSERRNLEQLRGFFAAGLIMGLIGNISYFLRYKGISIEFFSDMDLNWLSIMMIFSVLIIAIFSFGNIKLDISEDILLDVRRKTLIYKIICILFAIYSIGIFIAFKDLALIRLEIIIEAILILLFINERKIKSMQLTDKQLRWKRDFDYPGSLNKESNIFWRMKIRFYPRINVNWKDRLNRIRKYNLFVLVILILVKFEWATYLFIIFFISDIIYFIEIIFGLYTKTSGICTGIIDITSSKSNIQVYKVFITNYETEEEITFKVRNYCYIQERDEVVVVHGMISKRVIEVQGVRMDFI
ncbi:hypothetical protein ACQPUY_11385 [Clostridium nigeriense]|uniref:hypothetical protein n=1 Tax=Clostridium nigeriense TaxID=1805470 RepID=UPI003D34BD3D